MTSFSFALHRPAYPFFNGDVAPADTLPNAVSLAGVSYPIDTKKYRYNGLASFRDTVVNSTEPGDQMFSSEGGWWRSRYSWHHGAGQEVLDLDAEADPFRFFTSRGIDPWEQYQATLLRATTKVLDISIDPIKLIAAGGFVYARSGAQTVNRSSNLTGWASITGLAAENVVALTTDGSDAYIATTEHVYRVSDASVAATSITSGTPTNDFTNIAFVANRLIAGDGNRLVEVGPTSLDDIYVHFQTEFRWTTIFQVGSRIYVGGYAGNRSELYTLSALSDGSLALAQEAASFLSGELLNTAISYGGAVILGTSLGVRFATLGSDGTLQYGPLIEQPGNVTALTAQGRFAWFSWETFPGGGSGVGRLALDQFVNTLQPAHATDVYTEDLVDDVVALARFNNRTLFAVAGEGIYASSTTAYVTSGELVVGDVYFGTIEDKSITEVLARTEQLATGQSIELELFDGETGDSLGSGVASAIDDTGVVVNVTGSTVNRLGVTITLTGPGTSTPVLRHWRARAYPIAPPVEEWIVPLIIHRAVLDGDGQGHVRSFVPWDEVERLKTKWRTKETVVYQEGDHPHRVRIDNLQIDQVTWDDGSHWFDAIVTVRLLSV